MNEITNGLLHNGILTTTLLVWWIAQSIKVFLGVIKERKFNFKWFIGTGGMPSSHAAGVAALATSCGLEFGFGSGIFALSAVFALVTMFDAQGVRRCTGQQAEILNRIMEDMYAAGRLEYSRVKELIGHTPFQVFVGALLGMVISLCIYKSANLTI